jgi:hypothetical protein
MVTSNSHLQIEIAILFTFVSAYHYSLRCDDRLCYMYNIHPSLSGRVGSLTYSYCNGPGDSYTYPFSLPTNNDKEESAPNGNEKK